MRVPQGISYQDGLVPVVAQDRSSGDVLMVAFANAEAVERTTTTGLAHFWSRSRKRLWRKGEESGNELLCGQCRGRKRGNPLLAGVTLSQRI